MKRQNRLDELAVIAVCVCLLPGLAGAVELEAPASIPEAGVHLDLTQPMAPGLQVPSADALDANPPPATMAIPATAAELPAQGAAVPIAATPQVGPTVLSQAMSIGAAVRQSQQTGEMAGVRAASNMTFDSQKPAAGASEAAPVDGAAAGASADTPAEARLQPSTPQTPEAAAPEQSPYAALVGTWVRISGDGYAEKINITASGNTVMVTDDRGYGYSFTNINGGPTDHGVWKGNFLAPGGTVTGETTTRFDGKKLESVSNRYETHLITIPTDLVETRSLELKNGQLIEQSESTLLRKAFFYFGPYNVKSGINTSNLADPNRPLRTAVYQRAK